MNKNECLIAARKEADLTQVELAKKAGISERSYQRIESGKQDPRTTTSQALAKALNTTVETIFPAFPYHGETSK